MAVIQSILYVVVLIGVLVFVHEFGHYLAAKLLKVRVINFSIGFGPRIFGFRKWDTDWVVRWLPLGGYVQMFGADPMMPIPQEDLEVSFQHKALWKRAIIILAGPLANLLLPIPILFFVLLGSYEQDHPPVVGQVIEGQPADGKLERGDEVVAIDGHEVRYWSQLLDIVSDAAGEELEFTVLRGGKELNVSIVPQETLLRDQFDLFSPTVGRIGIAVDQYGPVISVTDPGGPASKAGLKTFDEVASVNGEVIKTITDPENALDKARGQTVELIVLREDMADVPFGRLGVQRPFATAMSLEEREGAAYTGLSSAEMIVSQVMPDSPAAKAGLQRGDNLLEMDGRKYNLFGSLIGELMKTWEDPHKLKLQRGEETLELTIQLEKVTVIGEFKEERPVISVGFYNHSKRVKPDPRDVALGDRFAYAGSKSIDMTIDASTMLVVGLYRMAEGRVSTKSIGGPIMIGAMASKAGEAGIEPFLRMLATISINLGIINLLPIPVLDGGQLMLFVMEAIKRGPLSIRTRQIASYVGIALVIFLMLFAFKNDFERYFQGLFG